MSQLKQLQFQEAAALQIAERFDEYLAHPKRRRRPTTGTPAPYLQSLAALTSAGKTPILAQAISHMRVRTGNAVEPIILWMSKSKSVVAQTHGNFAIGGKYAELITSFELMRLNELSPADIRDASKALLVTTTTGLFNDKEGTDGNRKVYEPNHDVFGGASLWDRLIARATDLGRRPLIIVYDEAHNISDQQSDILEELEPDAYVLASATLRLPNSFIRDVLTPVRDWANAYSPLKAKFLVTEVDPKDVVAAELVKKSIELDGSTAPMEASIDKLFSAMGFTTAEASHLHITPKAIYVCNTNTTEDGTSDNPDLPFEQRRAPPIRIWNYLVNVKKVPPCEIAVYSSELTMRPGKKPSDFNLFGSGDADFEAFKAGNFKHVIFNQSLKEGWDDPECYFAYIDKGLGSSVDIEQIMGRLLRQPNATHYAHPCLNTATFFLRVDSKNVFSETADKVQARLNSTGANINFKTSYSDGSERSEGPVDCAPRVKPSLGKVSISAGASFAPIERVLEQIAPFDEGSRMAQGAAESTRRTLEIGASSGGGSAAWHREAVPTRLVRLRWLLYSKLRLACPRAADAVCLEAAKYDSKLYIGSLADRSLDKLVGDIGDSYYRYSDLVYLTRDQFIFPVVRVRPSTQKFEYSLYPQYGAMNKEEADFAEALERRRDLWHRNPSNEGAGYAIPLLDGGDTRNFYPDFIVWTSEGAFCLDTKGKHLLQEAVQRKLFNIYERDVLRLRVRFIVKGKQDEPNGPLVEKSGFTVWRFQSNNPLPIYCEDIDAAVTEALRP